ncbi:hypothetical protein CWR48_12025 [Oceanobacillus arenosus]|uniref:DUF4363 domain-containing protein n=1 Tax=Oceanobacillus arenosus TaxID=1229153 RepID=A0A3D8PRG4_9BACI|nr:DUF4363 family protein [Oceanobacillus arenosus]RDW18302.1 hypothetical protein CWR48_12025 [Oceanobacillus arenosus]
MIKKLLISLFLVAILSGCTNPVGGDYFFEQIDIIEQAMNERQIDWQQIEVQSKELKKLYKENKWRTQLIGDEREYEGLSESIAILIAAVDEKDATQAKVELATIKSIIEDIYSL